MWVYHSCHEKISLQINNKGQMDTQTNQNAISLQEYRGNLFTYFQNLSQLYQGYTLSYIEYLPVYDRPPVPVHRPLVPSVQRAQSDRRNIHRPHRVVISRTGPDRCLHLVVWSDLSNMSPAYVYSLSSSQSIDAQRRSRPLECDHVIYIFLLLR